jgi:two-component system, OmpR family, alkaline phosphatase synthesis response regulator PhoP
MSRILVVEDEQHIAEGLRFNLIAEHHDVEVVETGEAALAQLAATPTRFDLVILDVMLPGVTGFSVAADLRRAGQYVPVLMLTARASPEDVLHGFASGADDYLPKPFELPILLARVQGLLRRRQWFQLGVDRQSSAPASSSRFTFRERTIDFEQLEVQRGDKTMPLTLMEASLLRYLVEHEGRPVARKTILEKVWGVREDTDTRAIDNFIVRLRRHLEDEPSRPRHLQTVRGVGYRFVADPD